MAEKKPARDVSGLSSEEQKSLVNTSEENRLTVNQGTFGSKLLEPVPQFIKTESEKVISNDNNAHIVLGRDRPANVMSGYGGRGDTQAASIDLVVGRMGPKPKSDLHVDPEFKRDAARIYISQKTDIDANFACSAGTIGSPDYFEKPGSAIAIKADGVRILARDSGIKLITGIDNINSQGGEIKSRIGIDLIAGNDNSNMQPLVKGDNLREALVAITNSIAELSGIVSGLVVSMGIMQVAIAAHVHVTASSAGPGTAVPDPILATAMVSAGTSCASRSQPNLAFTTINQPGFQFNYLNPLGDFYINSKNNHTN